MRVVCVKKFTPICINTGQVVPVPDILDKDTVVREFTHDNVLYYELERFQPKIGYEADHFATLPDQEPSVVNEEEQEAIIYQR